MIADIFSRVFDVQVNYLAVILAAVAYFILSIIWYLPQLFGKELAKHEIINPRRITSPILSYILEFIVNLIMAYVLALIIEFANVISSLEGLKIAFWMWLGFVATTHLSDVLWGRKGWISYLFSAGFFLVGMLVMGALIPAIRDYFPTYTI